MENTDKKKCPVIKIPEVTTYNALSPRYKNTKMFQLPTDKLQTEKIAYAWKNKWKFQKSLEVWEEKQRVFPTGSSYIGQWNKLNMNGFGSYLMPHGVLYTGHMKDGCFHGHGILTYPNGLKFDAIFDHGQMIRWDIYFADGLKYDIPWNYCRMPDRRYYTSCKHGLSTDRDIPPGYYDVGEGVYDPNMFIKLSAYDTNKSLGVPNKKENEWIRKNCRHAWDEPTGYRPDLYEKFVCGTEEYSNLKQFVESNVIINESSDSYKAPPNVSIIKNEELEKLFEKIVIWDEYCKYMNVHRDYDAQLERFKRRFVVMKGTKSDIFAYGHLGRNRQPKRIQKTSSYDSFFLQRQSWRPSNKFVTSPKLPKAYRSLYKTISEMGKTENIESNQSLTTILTEQNNPVYSENSKMGILRKSPIEPFPHLNEMSAAVRTTNSNANVEQEYLNVYHFDLHSTVEQRLAKVKTPEHHLINSTGMYRMTAAGPNIEKFKNIQLMHNRESSTNDL